MTVRQEFGVLAAVAVATVVAVRILPRGPVTGLAGRYWTNASRTGPPSAEVASALPSTADLLRALHGRASEASAEWSGLFSADDAGAYRFELRSDDGSWLVVDGRTVIDNGGTHAPQTAAGSIALARGLHRVLVRYFQSGGGLALELWCARPGRASALVVAEDFAPSESAAKFHARIPFLSALALGIPIVWALVFLYVPVRVGARLTWRAIARATPASGDRLALGLVAVLAIALLVWGITWGLTGDAWAADELKPNLVRDALARGFSHGWHDKYPPLHYMVLSIPVSAFALADRLHILPAGTLGAENAQLLLMRGISVLMALGTLAAAYLCAVELRGPRLAILAPLALLLTPTFLYYGKMANLDVPSLCWLAWAFVFFLRICRSNRLADYVWLGLSAAAAVATKDQAYASLALVPFAIVIVNARRLTPRRTWWRRAASALADGRVIAAGSAAAVAFALFHNLPFNRSGFMSHVRMLAGWGGIALVPRTAAGYAGLARTSLSLYRLSLGWPLFVMGAIGLGTVAWRPERRWWGWLALTIVSFHLFFSCVSLFVTDRYQLGGTFVLAILAGAACADLLEADRWRRIGAAVVAIVLSYSLLYAASIDVMMDLDGRYEARRRLTEVARDERVVALVGEYMPGLDPPWQTVRPAAAPTVVSGGQPDLVMVNVRFARRFEGDPSSEGRELLRRLDDGSLGYAEAFRVRRLLPGWAVLQYEEAFSGPGDYGLTNLNKVNPEIVVYRRREP